MHTRSCRWLTRATPLLAAVVVVLVGGAVSACADTGVGSWSATGPMPQSWGGGAVATLVDGRVLAVAGDVNKEPLSTELYNPGSGAWTTGPQLPAPGREWTLVALAEGGALLLGETKCGGIGPERKCLPTVTTYRLNLSSSEWSPAGPMHQARVGPVVVRLADGQVLVAGGFGDECPETFANGYSCRSLSSAEIYDPASNEWSTTASMPQARGGAVGTLLSDGTVLVVGGDEAQDAVRYDPSVGNWTAAGKTASPRTGSLLFALPGGRALTLGEESSADFYGYTGDIEYDPPKKMERICNPGFSSEMFTAVPGAWMSSLMEPGGSESCTSLHGALLAGGQILVDTGPTPTNGYEVLDAAQRCWSTTPPPLEERNEGAIVAALSDGRALVFAGRGGSESRTSSAEIYTPGSPLCPTPAPVEPTPIAIPPPSRFTGATVARRTQLSLSASGSLRLLVQCPASAAGRCVGYVRLALITSPSSRTRPSRHRTHLYLGGASFSIPAGGTSSVIVRLADHIRALNAVIRRWRHATIALAISAHDSVGQTATTATSGTVWDSNKTSAKQSRK
jgi:Kelch motif